MAVELYIEDKPVDLSGNEGIGIDYAIQEIGNLQGKSSARSYSFTLLKTAINRAVFENPDDVNSLSTIPYRNLKARLVVDGLNQNMVFARLSTSKDAYEINLYGLNAGFYTTIKERMLTDLILDQFDHFRNFDTIYGSRSNTGGFIYPVIDYATDDTVINNIARSINTEFMFPAMFADDLVQAIVEQSGYKLQNDLLNDSTYQSAKLLVPYTGVPIVRNMRGIRYIESFTLISGYDSFMLTSVPRTLIFSVSDEKSNYFANPTTVNDVQPNYYFADDIHLKGRAEVIFENGSGVDQTVQIEIKTFQKPSPLLAYVEVNAYTAHVIPAGTTTTVTLPFSYTGLPIKSIAFTATVISGPGMQLMVNSRLHFTEATIVNSHAYDYTPANPKTHNYVTMNTLLPTMEQSEFLKNYALMYGLLIVVNEMHKTVRLVKFSAIGDNVQNALDWSNKLDLSDEPQVKYVGSMGRVNNLVYEEGPDPKPEGTDGSITVSNPSLEPEKEMVKVAFVPTVAVSKLIDVPVSQIGLYTDGSPGDEAELRMLLLTPKNTSVFANTSALTYFDTGNSNTATVIPVTRFIEAGYTYNLGFGNSLIEKFFYAYGHILDNYKHVECKLRLTAADINQLDFTRPVYIKYFNSYFYLNAVKGYSPMHNESTTVELVKLF